MAGTEVYSALKTFENAANNALKGALIRHRIFWRNIWKVQGSQ